MAYKSKYPAMMKQYSTLMAMAHDKSSTLYNPDGSQRAGAGHRDAFWRGFNFGDKYPNLIPARNTIAYPCFRAGMDFAKEAKA